MVRKVSADAVVKDIQRKTRRKYSAEEKIRTMLEGLRGEGSIAELCQREGIRANLYYRWSKDFLEAGKKRLVGDTAREASIFPSTAIFANLPVAASGHPGNLNLNRCRSTPH